MMGSDSPVGHLGLGSRDELLHAVPADAGHEWTETSYYGFSVPAEGINAVVYHWLHPVLRVVSGGVIIWRGRPRWAGQADHLDYRNYLPFPDGDLDDVEYASGVAVRVERHVNCITARYRSEDGATTFEIRFEAVSPPIYRPGGGHFAQVMATTGQLRLHGREHRVHGFFTRNRSFDAPRSEGKTFAPVTWSTPVFSAELAYHFVGSDPVGHDERLEWGFVWDGDTSHKLTHMDQQTTLASDGGLDEVIVRLEDETGERHHLRGTAVSSLPMPYWPNMIGHLSLMRWVDQSGRTGIGDCQLMLSR